MYNKSNKNIKHKRSKINKVNNRNNKTMKKTNTNKSNKKYYKGGADEISKQENAEMVEEFFARIGFFVKDGLLKGLDILGKTLGTDFSRQEEVNQKLYQIRETLTSTQTIKQLAELGALSVEASMPFIKPLIDNIIDEGGDVAYKIAETIVRVILNSAEEIPGVGIILGTVRSISNVGEAILSSINSGLKVYIQFSDTIGKSIDRFKQLKNEKMGTLNRTQESIQNFQQPKSQL